MILSNNIPMNKRIVVENLRSAYNVGNIIRTADALWWGVVFVWYTARPDHKQVKKTALGAEETIPKKEFENLTEAYRFMQTHGLMIAAEITETSISLTEVHDQIKKFTLWSELYVIVGNEVTGIEDETLQQSHITTHIPMLGIKESLNVGQAAAIMMRELQKI